MNNLKDHSVKRNRFLIYLLVGFLVTAIDFLSEINEGVLEEELFFATLTLPSVLGTCYLHFFLRKLIANTKFYKKISLDSVWQLRFFWSITFLVKTLVLAFFARYLSKLLLPEFDSGTFLDILFWGIFIGVFCIGLFVYTLESFIELQKEKQEFQLQLKDTENEKLIAKYLNLKKQLNPHFLFNSFNSLSGLISIDPKKADLFVSELSNVYRYTLDQSDEILVPLKKELALIRSYIALQEIRFGNSIRIDYNISDVDLEKMIPPMTLELLVENAIKHNIVEKEQPLTIKIYSSTDCIVVSNNYQPRNNSGRHKESTGKGLNNLKNQYGLIHTEKPSFKINNGKYIAVIPLIQPN